MKRFKKSVSILLAVLLAASLFAANAAAFQPIRANGGEETIIKEIYVTGNVVPQVDQSVTTDGIKVSAGLDVDEIFWLKKNLLGGYDRTQDTKFARGAEYMLCVVFSPANGYELDPFVKAYVKTEPAEIVKQSASVYVINYAYPPLAEQKKLEKAEISGIDAPADGKAISTSGAKITQGLTLLSIDWYKEGAPGDFRITSDKTFQKGEVYGIGASFKADFGYSLSMGTPFEIAGHTVETPKPVNGVYSIFVDFPQVEGIKKITVSFLAAPGSVSPTTKTVTVGGTYGSLPVAVCSGRTFIGWYDGDARVKSSTVVEKTQDHTLVAKWDAAGTHVNINFDPNGGTVDPANSTFHVGYPFEVLPIPTRNGYEFKGWYDPNGTLVTEDSIVPQWQNMKLTASWSKGEPRFINVLFNANGGTVSPTIRVFQLDEPYGELPTPTRKGYIFDGWYDADGNLIEPDTIVVGVNNKTLTAKWTKATPGHTAHTYNDGVVTKEATCTETGEKVYTCTGCGATKIEILPITAHDYELEVTRATPKENGAVVGICANCGETVRLSVIPRPETYTLSTEVYTYNGKAKRPGVTITDTEGNIIPSKFYTRTFTDNKKVGVAKVKITFRGDYKGSKTLKFKILPKKSAVKKVTAGEEEFTASWKQVEGCTGYQLQYAFNSEFQYATTIKIKGQNNTKRTIENVPSGCVCYVRVRAYQKVGKSAIYSNWCTAKRVVTR